MKQITLKFSCTAQMLEYIRASSICNYDLSMVMKLLTADLSEEQIVLAGKYNANIADFAFQHMETDKR